jgi:hypothetical protein
LAKLEKASALVWLVLALAGEGVAVGQISMPIHVVPVVGNVAVDKAAPWRTDLEVVNLSAVPSVVGLRFFPEKTANAFDGTFAQTLALAPGETRKVTDVLSAHFAELRGRRGWLLVADATPIDCKAAERPYPALLMLSSRTYRDGSKGAGGAVQPSWLAVNATPFPSVLMGSTAPTAAAASRRSIGVANVSTSALKVRIQQLDPRGQPRGSADRTVPALSLGMWTLSELKLPQAPGGGRIEVALAEDPAINPCTMAQMPRPCADPCDPKVCSQRYRLPAAPAFYAFSLVADHASGVAEFTAPSIDYVGAVRYINEYRQKRCPDLAGAESIVDLGAKLLFLRDPAALRKVGP